MSLTAQLTTLETSGLLRLAQSEPELEYLFRHGLIQDAAYESLLKADRRILHRTVAESLERLYPEALDDFAATLAHHFELAEVPDKALDYFSRAAHQAHAVYANAEAIAFYRAAVEQARRLPHAEGPLARLYEHMGDVLELSGQLEEARVARDAALKHAADRLTGARLRRKIGRALCLQHRYSEATQAYDLAEQSLDGEPTGSADWQEWLQIQVERMEMYYWQGQLPELAELVERVRPPMRQYGTPALRAHFYDSLISVAERRDRYRISDDTLANARAMLAASHESSDVRLIANSHFQLGFVLLWHDDFDEAEAQLQKAEDLLRRIGDIVYLTHVLTYLGLLYRRRGHVEAARHYIQQTLTAARANALNLSIARAEANVCWLAWREARPDEAQHHGQAALELWARVSFADPFQWMAHLPLLGVALRREQIVESLRLARAMLEPTQHRLPDLVNDPLAQAIHFHEQGQISSARSQLQQALAAAEQLHYL